MRIALVAGEPSGDRLGAGLIEAIRAIHPDARFEGVAGPRMVAAGCHALWPMERLSVMGLSEAVIRLIALMPARYRLARHWIDDPPAVFVGIDAPDFNLTLERLLRRGGVPTVHYVSPSVWAWRRYRLRKIANAVDRVLTLFPFETGLYERMGIASTFVGHPLADEIRPTEDRAAARFALGLEPGRQWVALLPGSRLGEVERLAGPLVGAARWLAARRPGIRFVVPLVDRPTRAAFERTLRRDWPDGAVQVVDGRARVAMEAAAAVLVASGTASLEAMLVDRPMVITYRTAPLTWAIGRRLLHVDDVGLPNLLAGRRLVPELLQDQATPARLGAALHAILADPRAASRLSQRFRAIGASLRRGADARAAQAVLEVALA